jgi:Protein of unknown function (DUF2934)
MLSSEKLLWQAYRDAFREFKREADRLAEIQAKFSFDPGEAEKALSRVEQARLTYNETRDTLAVRMMTPELSRTFSAIPVSTRREQARVKSIAELIWELTGKPQGSADDDWYRAERVARRADAEVCCAR